MRVSGPGRGRVFASDVFSGMSSLAVSVAEGEDELVQRSGGPEDKDQEDGLGLSVVHTATVTMTMTMTRCGDDEV